MIITMQYSIYNHATGLFYLELNRSWVSFNEASKYDNIGEAYIQIDAILKANVKNNNFCLTLEEFYTIR